MAEGAAAEAVREALARARRAGAKLAVRPARERLEVLGRWLDDLADAGSATRRRLERELPGATGYTPEVVREGLARGLAPFTGDALHALVEAELGGALAPGAARRATGFAATAQLLGGGVPTATVPALLAPLVLGSPVVAKPAVHDPVTAPCLAAALRELDPELGACLEVVAFRGEEEAPLAALLEAECVVATGSDATVRAVASRVGPPRRILAQGHRLSVAWLGADAAADPARTEEALGRLALDLALWDQQGCLSPRALYVETGGGPVPERVLDAAARALAEAEARWPRGRLAEATLAASRRARELAELRAGAEGGVAVRADAEGRWTLVAEPDARFRDAPPARFLRLHPVADTAALEATLTSIGPHLAAVAVEGVDDPARREALGARLARAGASRICAFGALQAPPLAWCHEGRGVLLPLARLSDDELCWTRGQG